MAALVTLLKYIWRGVRAAWPYLKMVAKQVWTALRVSMMVHIRGALAALPDMAYDWQQEAFEAGVPTDYARWVYYGAYVVAVLTVVVSWLVSAHVTVWVCWLLVRLVF